MNNRLMSDLTIAKLFLVLREKLCDGDLNHPMRKHMTIRKMEKYTKIIDKLLEE